MYRVPRGMAADVTATIAALQRLPLPYGISPEPTGKPNAYVITTAGYRVTYELIEAEQIIKILSVEE
jgi:hypothetical protein